MKDTEFLLTDMYIIWDYDGVLCTYQAMQDACHIPPEQYLKSFITHPDIPFSYSRAPETLIELNHKINIDHQYVLTEVTGSKEFEAKRRFLEKHYKFLPDHVIGVSSKDYKVPTMEALYEVELEKKIEEWRKELYANSVTFVNDVIYGRKTAFKKQFVLVEDTVANIISAEDAGFTAVHITSLMN